MLLLEEIVFALCVSVLFSLLLSTANLFSRGKTTSVAVADVGEKTAKDNGFSKDGSFGGAGFVCHVFNESAVREGGVDDVAGAEVGCNNVGLVEKIGILGRVGFDEIVSGNNVKLIEDIRYLNSEISKEGDFSGIKLKQRDLYENFGDISTEPVKEEGGEESIEGGILEREYLKECVCGGVEFEELFDGESSYRLKNRKFVMELEKCYDNIEQLEEVRVLGSEISEKIVSSSIESKENLVAESPYKPKTKKLVMETEKRCDNVEQLHGINVLGSEISKNIFSSGIELKENLIIKSLQNSECVVTRDDEDEEWVDDWEGIESTELEKRFSDAVVFVGSKGNDHLISSLNNEAKMQLYGIYKVAIEGPCRVQQPMALKVSARAKWNAWHRLGDMSREVAMEQYIAVLSKSLPEWSKYDPKICVGAESSYAASNLMEKHETKKKSFSEGLERDDKESKLIGVENSNSVIREKE